VPLALNGNGSLRPETRQRVLHAAARLGFRPNAAARALNEGRTSCDARDDPIREEYYLRTLLGLSRLSLLIFMCAVVLGVQPNSSTGQCPRGVVR
jgi:hypothetical protein